MKRRFDSVLNVHSFWVLYGLNQSPIGTIVSFFNRFEMAEIEPF